MKQIKFTHSKSIIFLIIFVISAIYISGCVATKSVSLTHKRSYLFHETKAQIDVRYIAIQNENDAILISKTLEEAVKRASVWGEFNKKVTLYILPSHKDLENTVNRHGYPWLKAWARYDEIFLQAPTSWGGTLVPERLQMLISHELTHVAMYQAIGTKEDWYKISIPLWFREGMASYSAGQGKYRASKERIVKYFSSEDFAGDPIMDAPSIVQHHPKEVYGAGHWAFAGLVERHGTAKIVSLLKRIKMGETFREAWHNEFDEHVSTFLAKWRDELILNYGSAGNQ